MAKDETMNISLIHPTVRPQQALIIKQQWIDAANNKDRLEYIFGIDSTTLEAKELFKNHPYVETPYRLGCVNKYNAAALATTGQIIVGISDDFYPCQDWDLMVEQSIGDVSVSSVLACNTGDCYKRPDLLHTLIVTRAYMVKYGWVLHPMFNHIYADDFFTQLAKHDGNIKKAFHIQFRHEPPNNWDIHFSNVYQRTEFDRGDGIYRQLLQLWGITEDREPI
jgi:hypothetical protein